MEITRDQYRLDDETWDEVQFINSHAVFMGYLSMAVKGLGFLVLTWTTVVLLGGFVSMLQQKDFWCLTFITLVQTTGIFDVNMNEKLGYVKNAVFGLMFGVCFSVADNLNIFWGSSVLVFFTQLLLAIVLVFVQGVVLAAVLCPLVIVYMLGLLMSGGISLWRLLEHDYRGNSNSDSGETSNLAPAMDTLYYLALLQGVLFCYRFILRHAGKKLVNKTVGKNCDDTELHVLYNYLRETKIGCEKDPSFAKGRNLITHAIDKIGSNSPLDCISGVKILYTAIGFVERDLPELYSKKEGDDYPSHMPFFIGRRMLMKRLVMFNASSSKHILQKLLEMLDARGLHDTETRNQATEIVEHLAFYINLEDFPQGIQHIASLIETFEEYSIAEPYQRDILLDVYEQHWHLHACCLPPSPAHVDDSKLRLTYKESLLQGLSILRKLAANENNCRLMSNTRGLLCKIMAPVTSDLIHHTTDDHGAWSNVVERSMEVMSQLIGAPGDTGAKLRREISSFKKVISTLRRILSCKKFNEELQLIAIHILTRLYMDSESSRSTDFTIHQKESYNREDFVRMVVDIFMSDNNYSSSVRGYAGGALLKICFHEESSDATIVMKTSGDLHNLIEVLLHDKNEICRQAAAELLEHLCTHNTMDEEYIGKLKKAIVEVIGEIIHCGDETHAGKEADKGGFAKPETDIESQCYNGRGKGISSSSSSHPEKNEDDEFQVVVQPVISMKLLSSLLSLCGTFCDTFIMELGPYLAPHQLDASSFLNKLKEVVVKRSDNPSVENLTLYKAIGKMVISMKKHNNNDFVKQDLESLLEALSTASKNMLDLDHSMVFRSDNCSESSKDEYTLASLVKQAQELHVVVPSTSVSG